MVEDLKLIRTFGPRDRVGILEDDSWLVLWEQPNHQLVPHHHQDVYSVFEQMHAVIQKFLGVPVEESFSGPSLPVSLPTFRELIILGETQKAQGIASEIVNIMSLSVNMHTPAEELSRRLLRLRRQLGPQVRNEFKVVARGKLEEAARSETLAGLHLASSEAYEASLMRAREGMSITISLMDRTTILLDWVNEQEDELRRLKNTVGASLREINSGPIPLWLRQNWHFDLFGRGDDSLIERMSRIRGNPYRQIVERAEIEHLRGLKDTMKAEFLDEEGLAFIKSRFEVAYRVLLNVAKEREQREQSGRFDRYIRKPG